MKKKVIVRWVLPAFSFLCLAPLPALGQALTEIENIIVTSRKREEPLFDAPLALSVITREDLRSRGVTISGELARVVPNLEWQSIIGQATPQVFLRGIGNNTFLANQSNPIAIYTDGVYQGSTLTYGFSLFDVERVEILKGPQGTLYGRNTTGGLVNVITRSPGLGLGTNGYGSASYGNYDAVRLEAAAGFDVASNVAVRLSGAIEQRDGYVKNINPQSGFDESGKTDFWALRGQVLVQATDTLSIRLTAHGGDNESDIIPWKQIGTLCPPTVSQPALGQGCTDVFGFSDTENLFTHATNTRSIDHISTRGGHLIIENDFDGWVLSAHTGVESHDRLLINDVDASPADALRNDVEAEYWQVSQEIRATSTGEGPLEWIVGAFAFFDEIEAFSSFAFNDFGPGLFTQVSPFEEGVASILDQDTESYAVFGEIDYKFSDRLSVHAGLRWTYDKRRASTRAFILNVDGLRGAFIDEVLGTSRALVDTIPSLTVQESWKEWSGRIGMDYRLTESTLLYVTAARGFKGGDFNGGAVFSPLEANIVDPEFVYSLEAGVKGSWADGNLVGTASVFGYDLKDQQVQVLVPATNATLQNLANAAETDVVGAEVEIAVRPAEELTMSLGIGVLDAEFKAFALDASNPNANFDGNRTPFSPKFSLTGATRYETPTQFGIAAIQVGWSYRSARFFTVDNNPSLREGGTWLADVRVSLSDPEDAWSIDVWSENVFDEDYFANGIANTAFAFLNVMSAVPRTYGLTLSTSF